MVEVRLTGDLPRGARPDLNVDGAIEIENLQDILYMGRPAFGQENSTVGLFRLEEDGDHATRVRVQLGRSSINTIEILDGLSEGDEVILSDTSRWDDYDRIRLD
jgi:HlyD family secretion protein